MRTIQVTLTAALLALPVLAAGCSRDDGVETTGIQSPLEPHSRNPDPSSWDGTTVGDQERDHDVHRRLLRSQGNAPSPRPAAEERVTGEARERDSADPAAQNAREMGGSQGGTTGEFGGAPRGQGR